MKLNDFLKKLHATALVDVDVPNANKDAKTQSALYGGFADDALDFYKDDDINISEVECEIRYKIFCEPYPLEDEDDEGLWEVTYSIPLNLFDRVEIFSQETGISPNDIAKIALDSFLERQRHE